MITWLVHTLPLELRLWSKVAGPWSDPNIWPDDCWLWQGALAPRERPKAFRKVKGKPYRVYGRIRVDGRLVGPHRVALILSQGKPERDDWLACHTCDTPLCCNPRHLFWADAAGNVQDAFNKGRLARVGGRFATAEAA